MQLMSYMVFTKNIILFDLRLRQEYKELQISQLLIYENENRLRSIQ